MSHNEHRKSTQDDQAVLAVDQHPNGWLLSLACGHHAIAQGMQLRRVKQVKVVACQVCQKEREKAAREARAAELAALSRARKVGVFGTLGRK